MRPAAPAVPPAAGPVDHIAMLVYPGMTALDVAGPHHFLVAMPNVAMHLVTTSPDFAPVPSDLGLMVQPSVTMADCPKDLALPFAPGGTMGTLAVASETPDAPDRHRAPRRCRGVYSRFPISRTARDPGLELASSR